MNTVKIVDSSWYMPAAKRDCYVEYLEERIPGAVFFDIDKIADTSIDLPHMLPSPEFFAMEVEKLGISNSDHVVCYDSVGLFGAPRVWFCFKTFGVEKVSVLAGGLPRWKEEGRPLDSAPLVPAAASTAVFIPRPPQGVWSRSQMVANLKTAKSKVIDARPAARFSGLESEPRSGLRSGHIPGSLNVPFPDLVKNGHLKPQDELREIFSSAGLDVADTSQQLTTTCGSGVTACGVRIALHSLGFRNVDVYDGSWSEWGLQDNASECLVEPMQPVQPVDSVQEQPIETNLKPKAQSHYQVLEGQKFDRAMLEAAAAATAGTRDRLISFEDSKKLLSETLDGAGFMYTDIEKKTMRYIRQNYTFTEKADKYVRSTIRKAALAKAKISRAKNKAKKEAYSTKS